MKSTIAQRLRSRTALLLAAAAVAVTAAAVVPVATAAPAHAGPIVCHTVATYHKPPVLPCALTPGNSACVGYYTYKRVCD